MPTFASLFTGFGLADVGAKQAGYNLTWGLEYDKNIAQVANENLGNVRVMDILQADPHDFTSPDLLHASPPCPSFSIAKQNREETAHDIAMADKVAEFIRVLKPKSFTCENVRAYRESQSFQRIAKALDETGYWWVTDIANAADFGVPQTRIRLIIRASLNGFIPMLPQPVPWVGWYQAIEDLIPTLPESHFAKWQLARLPEELQGNAIFGNQQSDDRKGTEFGYGVCYSKTDEPMLTVKTGYRPKAFLIGGANTSEEQANPGVGVSQAEEPTRNVASNAGGWKAFLVGDQQACDGDECTVRESNEPANTVATRPSTKIRAWLSKGRVVSMTPRALARFQSLPDWYVLPAKVGLACRGIGNGVPCKFYQVIAETLK